MCSDLVLIGLGIVQKSKKVCDMLLILDSECIFPEKHKYALLVSVQNKTAVERVRVKSVFWKRMTGVTPILSDKLRNRGKIQYQRNSDVTPSEKSVCHDYWNYYIITKHYTLKCLGVKQILWLTQNRDHVINSLAGLYDVN